MTKLWRLGVLTLLCIGCTLGIRAWRIAAATSSIQSSAAVGLSSATAETIRLELVTSAPRGAAEFMLPSGCGESGPGRCSDGPEAPVGGTPARRGLGDRMTHLRSVLGHHGDAKLLLLIVFSPADCSLCLQEATFWSDLSSASDAKAAGLRVVGIADQTTVSEMADVVPGMKLTFPVYVDRDAAVRRLLGVETTPFKVVIDREGSVLLVDGPHQRRIAQQEFADRVRRLMSR